MTLARLWELFGKNYAPMLAVAAALTYVGKGYAEDIIQQTVEARFQAVEQAIAQQSSEARGLIIGQIRVESDLATLKAQQKEFQQDTKEDLRAILQAIQRQN